MTYRIFGDEVHMNSFFFKYVTNSEEFLKHVMVSAKEFSQRSSKLLFGIQSDSSVNCYPCLSVTQ